MNENVISNQAEFDYRFVVYLINEVFGKDVLQNGAVYSNRKGKFKSLDEEKLKFTESLFRERVGRDRKRFENLAQHINNRCNILRKTLKKKNLHENDE